MAIFRQIFCQKIASAANAAILNGPHEIRRYYGYLHTWGLKVSDRKGSAKAIFLAVLAIEFGMFLWLAILFDAPLFTPIHQGVRLLYANVVCSFLQFSLQRKASNVVRIFPRRSSTEKLSSRTFSLFFSDLDIGICVSDKENIAKLRDHFYQLKSRLIFMGELEVYTFREFEELESLEEDIGELYQVLRDMRKIGWIKGQLKTQKRNYRRAQHHAPPHTIIPYSNKQKTVMGMGGVWEGRERERRRYR